jgi:hypothetical protein
MFAVGHLALGYLGGKATSKLLKEKLNLPLLFVASVLPDLDILFPSLTHRGPSHSPLLLTFLFIPLLVAFGKKALPYYVALLLHPFPADYLTGGTQLLWPVSQAFYGEEILITSLLGIALEWAVFLPSIALMLKTKDTTTLLKPHPFNFALMIPIMASLLPPFFRFPSPVPALLFIPHLIYLGLFTLSILIDIKTLSGRSRGRQLLGL